MINIDTSILIQIKIIKKKKQNSAFFDAQSSTYLLLPQFRKFEASIYKFDNLPKNQLNRNFTIDTRQVSSCLIINLPLNLYIQIKFDVRYESMDRKSLNRTDRSRSIRVSLRTNRGKPRNNRANYYFTAGLQFRARYAREMQSGSGGLVR